MLRRGLLAGGGVAALAAALGWPGWLRKAFVGGEASKAGDLTPVPDPDAPGGMRRRDGDDGAPMVGAKTLFFVVPADEGARYDRGHAFGEFLNHGKAADLALLAGVAVECATLDEINARFGGALGGDPLLVVASDERPARLKGVEQTLPFLPLYRRGADKGAMTEEEIISQRIAGVGAALRRALGEGKGDVEARASQARLAVVKKPPKGGQWASSSGCGVDYEEGPMVSEAVDCGMGHTPEKSRRFLHFLSARAAKRL